MASLIQHETLLEALGFQKRGAFWEWQHNARNQSQTKDASVESARDLYFSAIRESVSLLENAINSLDCETFTTQPHQHPDVESKIDNTASDIDLEKTDVDSEIFSKAAKENTMKFDEVRTTPRNYSLNFKCNSFL